MKTLEREGADPRFSAEAYARRKAADIYAQGGFAQTFDMETYTAVGVAPVSGRLYLTKIGLAKGDLCSELLIRNNGALTAGTLLKFGICAVDMNGVDTRARVLGVTGDLVSAFGSAGVKTCPIATPFVINEDDLYYFATLFTGTTGPSMYARLAASVSGNSALRTLAGQAKNFAYTLSGMTDFPAVGAQFAGALNADGNNFILHSVVA
jgi:hypothetical protein